MNQRGFPSRLWGRCAPPGRRLGPRVAGFRPVDEAHLPIIDRRKHASEAPTVDLCVVLLMVHLRPILPASRYIGVLGRTWLDSDDARRIGRIGRNRRAKSIDVSRSIEHMIELDAFMSSVDLERDRPFDGNDLTARSPDTSPAIKRHPGWFRSEGIAAVIAPVRPIWAHAHRRRFHRKLYSLESAARGHF
jgi:hypothetical protein